MSWYLNWDASFDLAKGGIELSFRNHEDMSHLLVQTSSTRLVDNIIGRVEAQTVGPRYHILGSRGFGKSTLLNYMTFGLFNNLPSKLVLPVYASIFGTASSEEELTFIFFRSLLESLFDVPASLENFKLKQKFAEVYRQLASARTEYKQELKDSHKVSIEYIYAAFENQLEHLKKQFHRLAFLVDGLDKQDTNLVLKFFRNTQERLNNLIAKYDIIFVDSADPSWRETLGTKEFSGVRGLQIYLRGWNVAEVDALVRTRLHTFGIFQMPFESKSIEMMVEDFQGNPREILQYCTTLLHYGAAEHIEIIGSGITREIVWSEGSKDKFYRFIIDDANARIAFEKLKTVYSERQMFNILTAIYNQRNKRLSINLDYEERSSVGITVTDDQYKRFLDVLLIRGCISAKMHSFVELSNDILSLFDFVSGLDESLVALPVILGSLEFRIDTAIELPKTTVAIKQEIENVFQKHPNKWISYKQCSDILLSNPRKRVEITEYFVDNINKKLSQTINLTLYELLTSGKLMIDEESREYRWRPTTIDYELSALFKSKKILDLIDSANETLNENKFDKLREHCKSIITSSFSKLDNLLGGRIGTTDSTLITKYLHDLNVNVDKPIPLALVFRFLNEPIRDRPEGLVCLQAAVVYAKRIFDEINKLKPFDARNQELINKLSEHKTGYSKEKERKYFNRFFLLPLLNSYGALVNCMTHLKILDGISYTIPKALSDLQDNEQILNAKVYKCPVCGNQSATTSSEKEPVLCLKDKVQMEFTKDGYVLSPSAYEAWTVWMEQYTENILEYFPIRVVETGIMLKSMGAATVSHPEEIDLVVVYNGQLIAIECIEKLSLSSNKNDIRDIIYKVQNIGLFDAIILVYAQCDDIRSFNAEIAKNKKFLFPVQIGSPKKFKRALYSTIKSIREFEK